MFHLLFGPKDPTRAWQPGFGQSLTFDLNAGSINNIGFGQRLEALSFLGPAEDRRSFRHGEFCWHSLGVCIECDGDDHAITGFHIVFRDPDKEKYQSFTGRILSDGHAIDLSELTPPEFTEQFGECFWLDRDENESIMFYEFTDCEWQVEFDHASSLKRLFMTTRPLMAEDEVRETFDVTRAWPPDICS